MKHLIKNTEAQSGGLIVFIIGIFILGFFYVAFGAIMDIFQSVNNDLIADPDMEYSQSHWNTADTLFKYWWGFPIYILILFGLWVLRNSLNKEGETI